MSTRFPLAVNAAPPVSPAYASSWGKLAGARTLLLPAADTAATADSAVSTSTTGAGDALLRQYVSGALAAQTINGTVTARAVALESNSLADIRSQLVIRVVSFDGAVVRGTLLPADDGALASEWGTSASPRSFPQAAPATLTPVTAQDGDRLVVEIGFRRHNTSSTSRTGTLYLGYDPGRADLPDSGGTTGNPWIELSHTLAFFTDATPTPTGLTSDPLFQGLSARWDPVFTAVSYQLRHRQTGTTPWTTTADARSPQPLHGLTLGATYDLQVASVLPDGTVSPWSATHIATPGNIAEIFGTGQSRFGYRSPMPPPSQPPPQAVPRVRCWSGTELLDGGTLGFEAAALHTLKVTAWDGSQLIPPEQPVIPPPAPSPYDDNFDRADAATLGAGWDTVLTGASLVGGQARAATSFGLSKRAQQHAGENHVAQVTVAQVSGSDTIVDVLVRSAAGTASNPRYELRRAKAGGVTTTRIARVVSGVATVLWTTTTAPPVAAGDVMALRAEGATLTATLNGTQLAQVADNDAAALRGSTYRTAGIGHSRGSSGELRLDSYTAADLT